MSRQGRILNAAAALAVVAFASSPALAQQRYRVQIDSKPAGAAVYIDSKDDGKVGETPYRGSLPAGEHTLILERRGYARSETAIKVRPTRKRQKFRMSLTKLVVGTLEISAPSGDSSVGADVLIDGEKVGTVPDEFEIEVGPHQIEIVGEDDDHYEEWVEIKEGEGVTIEPTFGEDGGDDFGGGGDDDLDPTPKVKKRATPMPARKKGELESAMFVFETGLDLSGRHFSYSGAMISDNLRPYDADGVPGLFIGVELYPMATNPGSFAAKVGIDASFGRALGLVSSTSDGQDVNTDWTQVSVGLRVRHVTGGALISGGVGYGTSTVEFQDPPADIVDEVPEAGYKFIRLGVDGRIGSGGFSVFGGGDVLIVSEAGTTADRFADASTTGFGGRAGVAIGVADQVEARAVFRYRLFSSTYASQAGDTFFAEGATDHQYGVLLGGAFVY